jgi:SAM-dependent methyltransferase
MIVGILTRIRRLLKATGLLPVIKRFLYAPGGGPSKVTAKGLRYKIKILIEQANYAATTNVHDLPPIYDYWMKTHILPKLNDIGYPSIDEFFIRNLGRGLKTAQKSPARCISIGAGNCDFEVKMAERLVECGFTDFVIECLDYNTAMLDRGTALAAERDVARHIKPVRADFNQWKPDGTYDVVIANMSLHHVVNLEGLFDAIASALTPQGLFISADMIGRNGHMRWPESLDIINDYWRSMPERYRFNHMLGKRTDSLINFDCSKSGFEGVRAQDILPLLVERFHFHSFFGFANLVEPFVNPSIGPNLSPEIDEDRAFIDSLQKRDEDEMAKGHLKPTHMLAVMALSPSEKGEEHVPPMSAAFSVRHPAPASTPAKP